MHDAFGLPEPHRPTRAALFNLIGFRSYLKSNRLLQPSRKRERRGMRPRVYS